MTAIQEKLFSLREEQYAAFQRKLLPTVPPKSIIGVRTPLLRKLAKDMIVKGEALSFLQTLPHSTFDENQLHVMILSQWKDFHEVLALVDAFLPFVDNWATCDQLSPKVFCKQADDLLPEIQRWLAFSHPYTVRFAMGMLMQHFLDDRFNDRYLQWVAQVQSDDYYVRMEQAWYFATALAKQWASAFPYVQEKRLSPWIHQKTIQKAIESYRITTEQKTVLRELRLGKHEGYTAQIRSRDNE